MNRLFDRNIRKEQTMEVQTEEWIFDDNGCQVIRKDSTEEQTNQMSTNATNDKTIADQNWSSIADKDFGHELSSNVLQIKDLSSNELSNEWLSFANNRKMSSFRIQCNQSYNDLNCEQNLINDCIDFESICKMNTNLTEGFENSLLIRDYNSYKLLKWKYFLKWINRSQSLANCAPHVLPEFVAFGGLFTSLMMTVHRIESWTLMVCKFKDCIFMNKIRLNENFKALTKNRFNSDLKPFEVKANANKFVDKNPFFASKLTKMLTKSNEESINDSNQTINEFEKYFGIYSTQIGEHRLMLMSEMDAIDEEGNQYEIKCSKDGVKYGQKLLNWWSHCVVADIDYILIGIRDNNEILKRIDRLKVKEIPEMSEFRWNTKQSFDFVNRILNYIKDLLKSAKDCETYRLSFNKNQKVVKSAKMTANYNPLLPNWFTSGREESTDQFDSQSVAPELQSF